jgi:hypothetical protein
MTINTFFQEQYVNLGGVVTLHGRATGAGASALTAQKGPWAITRTGIGLHTITLNRKFAGLLQLTGTVIDVTTPDDWVVVPTTDLTSGQTIGIAIFKGGVAAELTTDEKILLSVTVQDTAVKPAGF